MLTKPKNLVKMLRSFLIGYFENLVLNPLTEEWTTQYPYNCNPKVLKNNKAQAVAMTERTERRLEKKPLLKEKFHEQVQDLIERKVFAKITEEEQQSYKGPVYYVTMHEVYKPDSLSTPIRLVINSSLKYDGISLNDVLMKGPDTLNNLYGIQLKFRTFLYGLVCDMSKMYHSVHTTEKEKHLRRVLYRENPTDEFSTYGITRAMFGDKPAAAITAEAIKQTARIYQHIDEEASQKIQEDTYVDDTVTGADTMEEVERLKVKIAEILAKGGFKVKGFVASGEVVKEIIALLGNGEIGRVLGVAWDPTLDEFSIVVCINISKKVKGARAERDLKIEEIPRLIEIKITLRILLGVTHSCYDAYGLVSPITVQMKIELRVLFRPEMKLGWDDDIPVHIKERWIRILTLLKSVESVKFKRCIKPGKDVIGKPTLIVCNDGSDDAMCATAHVRWTMKDGSYQCFLYTSKTRVTPIKKETTPRIEMQSAVLGARLAKTILTYSGLEFEEIIHIVDSTCTLAILQNTTSPLKEYMGNRASEVHSISDVRRFFHIRSKQNIADLGTRTDATIADISEDSDWQRGTEWMRRPRAEWPVTQDATGVVIPKEEVRKVNVGAAVVAKHEHCIDISRYKSKNYMFVMRLFAIILRVAKCRSFRIRLETICSAEIRLAEKLCIKMSMMHTKIDFDNGKLKSLGAFLNEDGIICVRSRAQEAMKLQYGADEFPILTYKDPLSFMWMKQVHEEDHSGVVRTVNKSRRKFWIIRARRLAHFIKQHCYRCRLLDIQMAEQKMAPLPTSRTKIAPVFYKVSMDLFGPVIICDTVKKRTRMKVWCVIFNCTVTRAIHIDLTADYSTDEILQTIMRFTSLRGCPGEIYSDQGSQLVAAAQEIAHLTEKWDWKPIQDWAARKQINWIVAPAEGHHQNGLSESMIRSIKRSIKHKVTDNNILTFGQLQTVLFQVADIINSRPIAMVNGSSPDHPSPITPNHLILGRATSDPPQGPFDKDSKNLNKKYRYLQSLVAEWWSEWYATAFPYLVPNYKWLQRHRNVKIGDVCLVRYKNEIQSTYRLARVQDVRVGEDGLVRTVLLKYKLPGEKTFRTVDRAVQGISVIVPVEEQGSDDARPDTRLNPSATEFTPAIIS